MITSQRRVSMRPDTDRVSKSVRAPPLSGEAVERGHEDTCVSSPTTRARDPAGIGPHYRQRTAASPESAEHSRALLRHQLCSAQLGSAAGGAVSDDDAAPSPRFDLGTVRHDAARRGAVPTPPAGTIAATFQANLAAIAGNTHAPLQFKQSGV